MEIDRKLKALDRIYAVYDEFVRTRDAAGKMHCHVCCTTRVTLTTLEDYKICDSLPPGEREKLFRQVGETSGIERFRPALTTNALAETSGSYAMACLIVRSMPWIPPPSKPEDDK